MGLNSTQAVRLGSITAGLVWIVLLFAPGSRADDATSRDAAADLALASEIAAASSALPTTPTTVSAPTTVAPTTVAAEKLPAPAPGPPTTVAPRVYSVRDIVGVRIDGATRDRDCHNPRRRSDGRPCGRR